MSKREILILDHPQAVYVRAAEEIAHIAGEAVCIYGEFKLCLSGGATPAAVYELLATRFKLSVDWKEVQFFWGDERCVPPDQPASNYAMVNRTMLSKLPVKAHQIHRVPGEQPPATAAQAYEDEIRRIFSLRDGELPRFDLILLGLGEDRHTASLFPGSPALGERERLVVAVEVEAQERHRVTITPAVINNAARVMFIACGAAKARAVKDALEGPKDPDRFPAQSVAPTDGEVLWLLDKAAASLVSNH